MTPEKMRKPTKPKLYFKHKDILSQIQIDNKTFCLYLQ